jgi:hypothetical protein
MGFQFRSSLRSPAARRRLLQFAQACAFCNRASQPNLDQCLRDSVTAPRRARTNSLSEARIELARPRERTTTTPRRLGAGFIYYRSSFLAVALADNTPPGPVH